MDQIATEDEVIAMLRANAGLVSQAAEKLGISRQALAQRIDRSERLRAAQAEIRETLIDLAEGNVLTLLKGGDAQTSRWYLQQQAKRRGYGSVDVNLRMEDDELAALVRACGDDVEALRSVRAAISGAAPDE